MRRWYVKILKGPSLKKRWNQFERHPAGRLLQNILPRVLKTIDSVRNEAHLELPKVWESLLGQTYPKMTEIIKFEEGVLYVRVKSAALYSLLSVEKKEPLLLKLKEKLPKVGIKSIVFRR